jgi:hypothetical protein
MEPTGRRCRALVQYDRASCQDRVDDSTQVSCAAIRASLRSRSADHAEIVSARGLSEIFLKIRAGTHTGASRFLYFQ